MAKMPVTMTRKDYFERIKFPFASSDAAHLVYLIARNRRVTRRYVVERTALVVLWRELCSTIYGNIEAHTPRCLWRTERAGKGCPRRAEPRLYGAFRRL